METLGGTTAAIALLVLMGLALLTTILGLPGTLIAFLLAFGYAALTQFAELTPKLLMLLFGMSVAVEVADQVLGIWAARRYGASVKGVIGSVLGGIVGAMLLGGLIPIAGSVIGAFGGAYAGALLVEQQVSGDWAVARRAAWGNFVGRAAGIMLKLLVGAGMIVMVGRAIL